MSTPRRVTAAQVKELWKLLDQGTSLRRAAMRSNMDRKTARKYRDVGKLPAEARKPRTWRTWPNAFAEVWPAVEEQLAREPALQAKTLWAWLRHQHPGKYADSLRRTFERRVREWKALRGQAREVFFAQEHPSGRLGASDFTSMNELRVTIEGRSLPHLVHHFVLTNSNWEWATLCFGEDFISLSEGLQNAFWALGGVPERHRTDRMTLAVHQDGHPEQFTAKYRALLAHYGVSAEATNPASGNENGDVESSHRHFKEGVEQALLLRGSRDFASREAYWELVQGVMAERNKGRVAKFAEEKALLRPLPARRLETGVRERVRVQRGSTIRVKKNAYSVPARLIGEEVEVRIGIEEVEVWYAGEVVQRMPRLRGVEKHRIDYRHVIEWLVRKPGAFARYVYREDLYPTETYRRAYDALQAQGPGRADREYVRILHLAAQEGEVRVEAALAELNGQPLSEQAVRTLLGQATALSEATRVEVPAVDLHGYDELLEGASEGSSDSGVSLPIGAVEESHEQGCVGEDLGLPAGTSPAGGTGAVRGGGPSGERGELELSGLPARVAGAGMRPASPESDRAAAEGFAAAAGEELGVAGSEASAAEGDAATAWSGERGLRGSAGERVGVWPAGIGEDARALRGGAGTGAVGPAGAVHDDGALGAGSACSQTRPDTEGVHETPGPVGGVDPGRSGLRAAEPGGDGGAVHSAGGAVRAGECLPDEQPAVLEVGADLQGCHDGRGGDRSSGASQRDRGVERPELSSRGGETGQER
jgi:transposase